MATRNPMNERYRGDGPAGKTKKSASSAKPVSGPASSVYVMKKGAPVDKRDARFQKQKKQMDEQAAHEKRVKAARKKQEEAFIAAGLDPDPVNSPNAKHLQTPEYKKWHRIYWSMLVVALVCIVVVMVSQIAEIFELGVGLYVLLGLAYITALPALILKIVKLDKLRKEHKAKYSAGGRKSPKQIKHETREAVKVHEMNMERKAKRKRKGLDDVLAERKRAFRESQKADAKK